MPSQKRVAWAQLRSGIVALVAMILLGLLVFLITGETSFFQKEAKIYTFLSDSAALAKGANVRYNGILIGRVTKVDLSGDTNPQRVVLVEMEVKADMLPRIPKDSQAAISAENVLGSKYINIKRGKDPVPVAANGELPAKDITEFEQVVEGGYNMLVSIQGMLKRIDAIVTVIEQGKGSIGKLIQDDQFYANLNGTAIEARKIIAQLNSGKGTISKLFYDEALLDDIRGTIARANSIIDGMQQGQGTLGKLLKDPALHDEMRKTLAEFRLLVSDLNAGKGTAGKLLKDEALLKQFQATLARMDNLLDKVGSGQGTIGQLMVNPQLYESMNGTMREMQGFMRDFRSNPKKFLSIKLGLF